MATSSNPSPADEGYYDFHDEDDAAHLHALGYTSEFKRDMSPWANFSLGFTYLSPVVGVYTLFAYALATGGPPMIWSFLIVGLGQLLVALVFSEVVAQFPVAGGGGADAEAFYGNVQVEIGSNNDVMFRGKNATAAHLGLCCLNCTMTVDRETLLEDGEFIPDTLRAREM